MMRFIKLFIFIIMLAPSLSWATSDELVIYSGRSDKFIKPVLKKLLTFRQLMFLKLKRILNYKIYCKLIV